MPVPTQLLHLGNFHPKEKTMNNYDDLRKAVEGSDGPFKVEMRILKRIDGAGRLGCCRR